MTRQEYILTFLGRRAGAIGIFYECRVTVKADTEDEAWTKLAEHYEVLVRRRGLPLFPTLEEP